MVLAEKCYTVQVQNIMYKILSNLPMLENTILHTYTSQEHLAQYSWKVNNTRYLKSC